MKKTLSVRPLEERDGPPKLQKRGRGWNVADSRLDTLHEMARQRRREPGEAQVALAAALGKHELGKYRLHQHVVIGSAIVAFACKPLKLAVELSAEDENPLMARRRDASLEQVGIKVLHLTEDEVLADADAAAAGIVAEMKARWHELRSRPGAGGRPSAGRRY